MKKTLIPVILVSSSLLLSGCIEQKNNTDSTQNASVVKKEDAVAVVNGKYISKQELDRLKQQISQRMQGQSISDQQLLEELIRREIIVQQAEKEGLDKTPEFQAKLNEIKTSLLTQAYLQDYLKKHPVTDEELKAEYDAMIGQQGGTEFKARHILVKSKDEADKIIAELNKGADFAKLAKEKSTGPSGPQGGDLGWFTADKMVKPFSDAVMALEDGKYTTEPVKTQFGWHVILREESRKQTPPPFEAVKMQLQPMLQRKKVQQLLEDLKKQAKVEILLQEPVKPKSIEETANTAVEHVESAAKETADKVEKTVAESADKTKTAVTDAVESAKQSAEKLTEKATNSIKAVTQ